MATDKHEELDALKRKRKELDEAFSLEMAHYRRQFMDLSRQIERLAVEIAREERRAARTSTRRERRGADPRVQAGPTHIRAGTEFFRRMRRATQAAMVADLAINSGTGTWTIKALELDGVIVATGRSVGRSREFEYVPETRRTRMEPGS